MLINLKTSALSADVTAVRVELVQRLPPNIAKPCILDAEFSVQSNPAYFVLHLKVTGDITIICQRCLSSFAYHYSNETELALCSSDELAAKLMEDYECIVIKNNQVDLIELLTDELYLFSPEIHPDINDCNKEINSYIRVANSSEK